VVTTAGWRLQDFREAERYQYSEMSIAAGYGPSPGGNFERGIVLVPRDNPMAIMIKMNLSKGLYPDSYDEEKDYFYYIGDGLPEKGHQKLAYGNKIMVENQGLPVYLFVRYEEEKKGEPWTFRGRWRITGVERDFLSTATVPNGARQKVFRFKLVRAASLENEREIFEDAAPVDMSLAEISYIRATPALLRIVQPRHKRLANQFARWLRAQGFEEVRFEQDQIDVTFSRGSTDYMSEIKVVYGVSAAKSIREAMGQVMEYNFYGSRQPYDEWLVLLDTRPAVDDTEYVRRLSSELDLPLNVGWRKKSGFHFQRPL
jgi:hypothetical protein